MSIFDLVFIAVFFTSCGTLIYALTSRTRARRILPGLAACLSVYYAIVFFTAYTRVVEVGDPMCNDDWCASAEHVSRANGIVTVEFRVWSRAKRVTQRETSVDPFISDEQKRRYPVTQTTGPPFDTAIGPGESFTTTRRFKIDPDARQLDLRLRRHAFPGSLIIATPDEVVRLTPGPGPV